MRSRLISSVVRLGWLLNVLFAGSLSAEGIKVENHTSGPIDVGWYPYPSSQGYNWIYLTTLQPNQAYQYTFATSTGWGSIAINGAMPTWPWPGYSSMGLSMPTPYMDGPSAPLGIIGGTTGNADLYAANGTFYRGTGGGIDLYAGASVGATLRVKSVTANPAEPGTTGADNLQAGGQCASVGMASYSFHSMAVSLSISDLPVIYSPPIGPDIGFLFTYNQKEAYQPTNWTFSNLGPKWTLNHLSYIEDIPTNTASVLVFGVPHGRSAGGSQVYYGLSSSNSVSKPHRYNASTLQSQTNGYTRKFPDGSTISYDYSDNQSPRRLFMTKRTDSTGQSISYNYETLTNGNIRLLTIIDASGLTNTFSYGLTNDPLKITAVSDPFGHTATLSYTQTNGAIRLLSITDPVQITSQFQWNTNDFISALITPYGTNAFNYSETANAKTLTATDPLGQTECLQYLYFTNNVPTSPAPTNVLSDLNISFGNSFYWNKKAWGLYSNDIAKADITHWAMISNQVVDVPLRTKKPLERWVSYSYPGQTNANWVSLTTRQPSAIGRVLDDGSYQTNAFAYDSYGNLTNAVDSIGRVTRFLYSTNGIDLLQVYQKNTSSNDLLATISYNTQHLPTQIRAAGLTNSFGYSTNGLLLASTNTSGQVTTYDYNAANYLTRITGHLTNDTLDIAYDSSGRVYSLTDAQGYSITNSYDELNRSTNVWFPDGTSITAIYDKLDMAMVKSRDNRWSYNTYDPNGRLTDTQTPDGHIFHYEWCGCGALESITDPKGQMTVWFRDLQNRPTQKLYHDLNGDSVTYETTTSRIQQTTDAAGKTATLLYNADDTVKQISYSGGPTTPSVDFTYDTNYARVTRIVDGIGTNTVTYMPSQQLGAGHVQSRDGPLPNDTISYTFDSLGRPQTLQIGSTTNAAQYDTIGRVYWSSNTLGVTTVDYVEATSRPALVSQPNGLFTAFSYGPVSDGSRLQSTITTNGLGEVVQRQDFVYDINNLIVARTNLLGTNVTVWVYEYDLTHQLTAAWSAGSDGAYHRYSYSYDKAGNRLSEQIDTAAATETPNSVNQVQSRSGGGQVRVSGFIDEPGSVSISGQPAKMLDPTNFTGSITLNVGTNTFPVSAVDPSGNTTTNWYNLTVTANGLATSFTYDKAGNLLVRSNSNQILTFGWDGADRCTAITNGTLRTLIAYDGANRWSRIQEFSGTNLTTDRRFVWNSTSLAEERDGTGTNVIKRFFSNGFQQGSTNYYYLTDHLGSVIGITTSDGTIISRFQYDPWGRRTQVAGTITSDYGFSGLLEHSSGLKFAVWRIYDPSTGRWINRDPIREDGGWNLYAYCSGDPVNGVDPSGLFTVGEWWDILCAGFKSLPSSAAAEIDGAINTATTAAIYILPTPRSWWSYQPNLIANAGFYDPSTKDAELSRAMGGVAFEALAARLSLPNKKGGLPQAECKAAEGIGEGPGAMTRLRYEANPKHGSFQRGTASPAPQAGQGALDGSVGFSPHSAGRIGLDADGVPVVFRQHTDGVFHGYRVLFEDLTAAQKNALIENGFVNRKGVALP